MKANIKSKNLKQDNHANYYAGAVGGLVALLVVIGVGAMIFYQITDNFEGTNNETNDTIDNTQEMGSTVFGLLPIIALVVVAAIIIGVVMHMGVGRVY